MNTVIIGSGNIATVLGEKMLSAGHRLCQVVGRREDPAAALARSLGCPWTTDWARVSPGADLYLVAIRDSGLADLAKRLSLPGRLIVHTAGSVPAAALQAVSGRCGVVWPVQSIRADMRPYPLMPLVIDAHRPEDLHLIRDFALSLSETVEIASDDRRLRLHLAATLVNNFTNYLYTLASGFCEREQIDFNLMLPLIQETAARLDSYPAEDTQTGPAVRRDRTTIAKHLQLLDNYQDIRQLYEVFSIQIEEHYGYERTGKI